MTRPVERSTNVRHNLASVLVLVSSIFSAPSGICADRERDLAPERRALERVVNRVLADVDPATRALYRVMSNLAYSDERIALAGMADSTRRMLWRYNTAVFVRQHAELSDEQMSIMSEAFDILEMPELFNRDGCDDACSARKKAVLDVYRTVAQAKFSRAAIFEAFIRLGPEPSTADIARPVFFVDPSDVSAKPQPNTYPQCDCASWYECWFLNEKCLAIRCVKTLECGFYGQDACSGICA